MKEIIFKIYKGLNNDIKSIREEVFCIEQKFDPKNEFDDIDNESTHIVAYYNNKPIGTARAYKDKGDYHIGRVAVLKEYRKDGIGKLVIEKLEEQICILGGENIVLSSQINAVGFYKKIGYKEEGKEYYDEHCLHIDMRKKF